MSLLIPLMNWIEKMADFNEFKKQYKSYEDSLKNASFDKENKEYLCLKEDKIINFEKLSLDFDGEKGKKRVDALFEKNKELFLVEFKNQKQSDIDKEDIKGKFKDSLNLLEKLFNELNLSFRDFKIHLYLVMKEASGSEVYKARDRGTEFESAIKADKADNFLEKFVIKCAPKQFFLPIYKKIFNESCQK